MQNLDMPGLKYMSAYWKIVFFFVLVLLFSSSIVQKIYAQGIEGTLKWSYTTGGEVNSSPAIGSDGTIYVGSHDGKLYAVTPTGTLKWSYTTGGVVYSSPAIGSDGTIYVGSADRKLYAVTPTGTLKWSYTTGGYILSSPAIGSDGTIYVGSYDFKLYAVTPTGTVKWSYPTGGAINSSPAIGSDGTIYIGSADRKLYAVTPTGTLKWSYTTGDAIESSPAIGSDGTIYVGSNDKNLYAITPTGTVMWSYTTGGAINSSPAIGSDGTIYVGSYDNKLYAITPTGTVMWSYTTGGPVYRSSPAVGSDGTIYVGSWDQSHVYAITPTGTLKWSYTSGGSVFSSPAIGSDGTIYVGSRDNKLYAIGSSSTGGLASSSWPMFHQNNQHTGKSDTINIPPTANTPPNASLTVTSLSGTASTTFSFDASGSSDAQDALSVLQVRWDWENDGTWDTSYDTTKVITHQYTTSGIYTAVKLEVKDSGGLTDDTIEALNLKWSFTTGDTVNSSPAIGSDGTIYVGSDDKNLYAITSTGALKWSYTTGGAIESSPAIGSDGTIYVGSDDKNLYAITSTGALKWSYTTGGAIESSPAIGSGAIYVGSYDNKLYAITPAGTVMWSYTTGGYVRSSPAIGSDGTIYVGSNDGKLYAITPAGTVMWSYTTGGYVRSSPAIGSDGTIYVGSNDGKLYAITPAGTVIWSYTTGGAINSSPAIGSDGTIYVGFYDNKLYAITPAGTLKWGYTNWSYTNGDIVYSSPAIGSDGTIYVGSYYVDNKICAVTPAGALKWSYTTGGIVRSSPAIGSDGTIYAGSYDGKLYALTNSSTGGLASSPWPMFHHDNEHTGRIPGTTPPTASFKVTPASGTTTTSFTFDASGSSDAQDEKSVLQVRWDWENNGTWDTQYSTTKTTTHQYSAFGRYTVKLEVKDSGGLTDDTTMVVVVSVDTLPHFRVQYTGTGNSSSIALQGITIGGQPIEVGDEIGVFTPSGLLAGSGVYDGTNIVIAANGDNDQTSDIIEGFRTGEKYKFKVWRKNIGLQYDSVAVTYESGSLDTYSTNSMVVITSFVAVNRSPVLTFTDTTISSKVGTAISFQVQVTDADNDSISLSITGTLPQGVTTASTGLISGTPADTGFFALQVVASDPKGGADTGMVRLSIRTLNRPPVLTFTDTTISRLIGIAIIFQIRAADADNDSISFNITGTLPQGVTTTSAGLISGTPTAGGSFPLQVIVSDGKGGLDTGTVRLHINRPPILAFTDTMISAQAGITISFQIHVTDADNDSIFFNITGTLPQGVTSGATGLISGTPTDTGSFPLQVIASDRKGGLDTGTVRLSIRSANRPPVLTFTDTTISGQAATALNFQVRATDADNDSVSFSFTGTLPQGITTTIEGLISGMPTDTGSFPLKVIVSDRKGGLDTGTVRLSIRAIPSLLILLSSGWNLISSNVVPGNTRMDSIFNSIVSKLGIAKNILGKVYWPRFSVNQIGNWIITEGYWVYMTGADTLKMVGTQVSAATTINLNSGWNIIAYLPITVLAPATALATLGSNVVIMKDVMGRVYWPRFSVNQIGTMQVGKGYLVYLSSAGTLTYPASVSKEGNDLLVENNNRSQQSPQHFAYIRGTGANATILVRMNEKPVINGTALEIGDEIGVFTPEGICAGAGVWNEDNIVITVWGDNGETMNIDGFTEGQAYNFRLWNKNINVEKDISVVSESGTLSYSENGITIISYEKNSDLPDNFVLRQNYPNPFNPTTRIEYQIKEQSEVTLAIYNTAGQLLRILVQNSQPAGVYSVEWDGKNSSGVQVPSGIYLYCLKAGNVVETRKMILMK